MKERKKEMKTKKKSEYTLTLGVWMLSVESVVTSPAHLATLSPLPPPPATMKFYSFMEVKKLQQVHRKVFTTILKRTGYITSLRRTGEDKSSENLKFHSEKG